MKRFISLLVALGLMVTSAHALTREQIAEQIVQGAKLPATTASVLADVIVTADVEGELVIYADNDPNRVLVLGANSDTDLVFSWGDGGTTANQVLGIRASTVDGDDDARLVLAAGGAGSADRGAWIELAGNEAVGGGDIFITYESGESLSIFNGTSQVASSGATGFFSVNAAYDIGGNVGGATLTLQEAVAGTACMGTATANGTTAVTISTSCIETTSRVFISRSSAPSGTAQCWTDTIVNGVSFNLDCSGAETGTFNWFIIHET